MFLDAAGLDASDLTVTADRVAIAVSGGFGGGDPSATLRRARITSDETVALIVRADERGGELVVSDAAVRVKGSGGTAVQTEGGPTLRNITGTASGSSSYGLRVLAQESNPPDHAVVRNSVFRGDQADLSVHNDRPPVPLPGGGSTTALYRTPLTITHSNFGTVDGSLAAGSRNNQGDDPLFADVTTGDVHPLAGSPLVDAGTADVANGPTDADGRARKLGAAPDIGAYEFPPPAPPGDSGVPGPPGAPPGSPGGSALGPDVSAPELTGLALTNRTFAVGRGATAVSARAKKGTTFRVTLSEAATVGITFERSEPGRRKGRRCVKPTRKNRKARKCRRWVKRGAIERSAAAGPVAIPFSGRIGKKALKTGSYRALVAARDAAGNRSRQRTVAFKIVKR
jgi:hypothetical protein